MTNLRAAPVWPIGGGETGELVRGFDWSKTSLGPISDWPQNLRQKANSVVNSPIPQVLMSMDGGRTGTMDRALAAHGLQRRVAMTVPHFHAVALAIAQAGLLGNLPVHFARPVAKQLDLDIYLPPHDPPIIDVVLLWHRRMDGNAANAWLRDHIARVMDFGRLEMSVPLAV